MTTILSDVRQTAQNVGTCCHMIVDMKDISPFVISAFAAVMLKTITLHVGIQGNVCKSLMLCSFLTNRWHCKQGAWPNLRPDTQSIGEHGQQ